LHGWSLTGASHQAAQGTRWSGARCGGSGSSRGGCRWQGQRLASTRRFVRASQSRRNKHARARVLVVGMYCTYLPCPGRRHRPASWLLSDEVGRRRQTHMKSGARQRRNRRRDEGGGVSRCQRCPCPGSRGLLFPALRTLASCECETQYLLMDAGWQQGRQHLRAPQGRAIARAALPCTVHALGEALRPATPALALVPGARRALRHDARPFPTTSGTLAAAPQVPVPRTTTQPSPAQPSPAQLLPPSRWMLHPPETHQPIHPPRWQPSIPSPVQ